MPKDDLTHIRPASHSTYLSVTRATQRRTEISFFRPAARGHIMRRPYRKGNYAFTSPVPERIRVHDARADAAFGRNPYVEIKRRRANRPFYDCDVVALQLYRCTLFMHLIIYVICSMTIPPTYKYGDQTSL